ncbi:PREDICTED: uncharacterized protein LOC101294761 [Fragaria vesca subsp. vesca]
MQQLGPAHFRDLGRQQHFMQLGFQQEEHFGFQQEEHFGFQHEEHFGFQQEEHFGFQQEEHFGFQQHEEHFGRQEHFTHFGIEHSGHLGWGRWREEGEFGSQGRAHAPHSGNPE